MEFRQIPKCDVTTGAGSTGTVTLAIAAPAGGALVSLTSSNAGAAAVPASVTVAAGATSATFAITTSLVTTGTVVTISASSNGASKAATIRVNPVLRIDPAFLADHPGYSLVFSTGVTNGPPLQSTVPEPATAWLALTLIGVVLWRSRKT